MSSTFKQVGNLIFNQQDGVVKHARTGEDLAKYMVKIAIPIHLLAKSTTIAIDSTGIKENTGHFEIEEEMLKHLSAAYLEAFAIDPTATDAVVRAELYNVTDASLITYVEFAGEGGLKKSANIADTLKTLSGKVLCGRINVTTASATSGATQAFRSIVLVLIYDLTK